MRCMCHAAQCAAFTGNLHNIGAWFGCNTNPGHKVPIITTCYQAVVLSCWHNGQSVNISQYNIPSCHLTRIPVMNLLADIMRANNSDVRWAAITTLPVCPIFVSNLHIILTLGCTGANMVTALHIAMHNLYHLSHYYPGCSLGEGRRGFHPQPTHKNKDKSCIKRLCQTPSITTSRRNSGWG